LDQSEKESGKGQAQKQVSPGEQLPLAQLADHSHVRRHLPIQKPLVGPVATLSSLILATAGSGLGHNFACHRQSHVLPRAGARALDTTEIENLVTGRPGLGGRPLHSAYSNTDDALRAISATLITPDGSCKRLPSPAAEAAFAGAFRLVPARSLSQASTHKGLAIRCYDARNTSPKGW
jgi:hypothetical protein